MFTLTAMLVISDYLGGSALSLVDCQTKEVLIPNCMPNNLKTALDQQQLPMSENFNDLTPYVVITYTYIYFIFQKEHIPGYFKLVIFK